MPKKKTKSQKKISKVMTEFSEGELNIGKSKKKVKSRKQAVAIALDVARREGASIPQAPMKRKAKPMAKIIKKKTKKRK